MSCRPLLQPSSGDQHWMFCVGSLHSRLQHLSLLGAGLCLLGYQWNWSIACHPNRSKPHCRLLPCKTSLPLYLCFAYAMSKELASTVTRTSSVHPVCWPLPSGFWSNCQSIQLQKGVDISCHDCIAQHLGWMLAEPQLQGMMSSYS